MERNRRGREHRPDAERWPRDEFVACGGKLYASVYEAILVRTDGASPSWQTFFQYSGALASGSSGFRGLTCVPNLNGQGSMLIAALEGDSPISTISLSTGLNRPLSFTPPTI